MKKLTFSQKVSECFLNDKELTKVKKLSEKEPALLKLLKIHDDFLDAAIQRPLMILVSRIEAIEKRLKDVDEYLNDGEKIKVFAGKDPDGNPVEKEYDKRIGILIDKYNGIAERERDMIKELKSSTEDALDIIHSKRVLLGMENTEEDELSLKDGLSWTDKLAERNKRKGK